MFASAIQLLFLASGPVRPYCLAIQSLVESARVAGCSPVKALSTSIGHLRLRRNAIHYAGVEQKPGEPDRHEALFAMVDQLTVAGLRSQMASLSARTTQFGGRRGPFSASDNFVGEGISDTSQPQHLL
jgi:hypothetical protein